DMNMQIDPTRRNPGSLAIDPLHLCRCVQRLADGADIAVLPDENIGRRIGMFTESYRSDIGDEKRLRLFTGNHITNPFAVLDRACRVVRGQPSEARGRKEWWRSRGSRSSSRLGRYSGVPRRSWFPKLESRGLRRDQGRRAPLRQ